MKESRLDQNLHDPPKPLKKKKQPAAAATAKKTNPTATGKRSVGLSADNFTPSPAVATEKTALGQASAGGKKKLGGGGGGGGGGGARTYGTRSGKSFAQRSGPVHATTSQSGGSQNGAAASTSLGAPSTDNNNANVATVSNTISPYPQAPQSTPAQQTLPSPTPLAATVAPFFPPQPRAPPPPVSSPLASPNRPSTAAATSTTSNQTTVLERERMHFMLSQELGKLLYRSVTSVAAGGPSLLPQGLGDRLDTIIHEFFPSLAEGLPHG
ncbi:MAG: hypothetical protein M1831_001009 [Alyxoria varia]|nr:MAG: hypothetical protein M1831_001009 [Alyxoria varia]